MSQGSQHIGAVLTTKVARRTIVANGEVWADASASVGKSVRAVLSGASDAGGGLPDDLRKVAPEMEVAHVRLTTVSGIEVDLIVVHQVADHARDIRGRRSSADVLAVTTPTGRGIMRIHTAGGDLSSDTSKFIIPSKVRYRVVGTVNVVGVENALLIIR